MSTPHRKVVIIGAGSVGATYAYTLMQSGVANTITLIDVDREKLRGEVLDLNHGLPFAPPVEITAGDYGDCRDADLIVVSAGAAQKSGQSRRELAQRNVDITREICGRVAEYTDSAVMVIATNPVDTVTQAAIKYLGWPRGRVLGSGTVLDTSRFRYLLSSNCRIDSRNIHAYILGEHGDSEVAPWSLTHIAGVNIDEHCRRCQRCSFHERRAEIVEELRQSAYHIIDYKGATFYGIGMALMRISTAVLRNENSVLTVSTLLDGEYGLRGVCLSVPCVIGENGVSDYIVGDLATEENEALQASAEALRELFEQINL